MINAFLITALIAITVYLGLAVYVIAQRPRRLISWIFGAFCFILASYYLTGFYLFPGWSPETPATPVALRWKWAALSFAPSLYLHLALHFFPASWRKRRPWMLIPAFGLTALFFVAALFTEWLVAGRLYRADDKILGPLPGPLMNVYAAYFGSIVVLVIAGLIAGYRSTRVPAVRRQTLLMLLPTLLLILVTGYNMIVVVLKAKGAVPHVIGNLIFILAAFSFAQAVLRHGALVGHAIDWRSFGFSGLMTILIMLALILITQADLYLMNYSPLPLPVLTLATVLVAMISFPLLNRWTVEWINRLFTSAAPQSKAIKTLYSANPVEDPQQLQAELLTALTAAVGAEGGYLALPAADSRADHVRVRLVVGNMGVECGQEIRLPPIPGHEPQMTSVLLPGEQEAPGWQEVALYCPLKTPKGADGLLALAARRNKQEYRPEEQNLCGLMARQVEAALQILEIQRQRDHHLSTARQKEHALQQLEQEMVATTSHALEIWDKAAPFLKIYILGPLRIFRYGQPVPAAAWGSDMTKTLLAFLLWKGRNGASRSEILEALWTDRQPEEASNHFHVTLHRLRRLLEPELQQGHASQYIRHERGRYRFDFDAPHWLDVAAFQDLAHMGGLEELKQAVSLYGGSYLEDTIYSLPSEAMVDVVAHERSLISVLRQIANLIPDKGEATIYLEKLLVVEPGDLGARRRLVNLYLDMGLLEPAQRQVVSWQSFLAEMELKPTPDDRALWSRVEKSLRFKAKN